jgi:hypothetical protein
MRYIVLPVVLLFCTASALSQPIDRDRLRSIAEQLLDAGADGVALAELGKVAARGETVQSLGAERTALLQRAWNDAFANQRLRDDVTSFIAARETPTEASRGLEWLRLPAVARVTSLMRAASGDDFDRAFGQWTASLGEDDLDLARLERIADISRKSGEERIGTVVLALAEAGIRGAHAAAHRGDRPSLPDALQRLRELGPTLTAQAQIQNQLYLYYVTRGLSMDQVQAYAEALDSPPGRWYVRVMADAIGHAVDAATTRLVDQANAAAGRR